MPLTFGLHLPHWPRAGDDVLGYYDELIGAVDGSFTSLWVEDHLQDGCAPMLEGWTRLTYLAARYPRFDVGHLVLCQAYRNPALLAKMAASLQVLTGGRFVMGLGAGWLEPEFRAYGYEFASPSARLEQLEETIHILRAMWGGGPATFAGRHFEIDGAYCSPAPPVPIPIMIGTNGPRALHLVARFADQWNWDAPLSAWSAPHQALLRQCDEVGRDPATITMTAGTEIHLPGPGEAFCGGGGERYGDPVVLGPTPGDVVDALGPLVEQGVSTITVFGRDARSFEQFCAAVAPRLA